MQAELLFPSDTPPDWKPAEWLKNWTDDQAQHVLWSVMERDAGRPMPVGCQILIRGLSEEHSNRLLVAFDAVKRELEQIGRELSAPEVEENFRSNFDGNVIQFSQAARDWKRLKLVSTTEKDIEP